MLAHDKKPAHASKKNAQTQLSHAEKRVKLKFLARESSHAGVFPSVWLPSVPLRPRGTIALRVHFDINSIILKRARKRFQFDLRVQYVNRLRKTKRAPLCPHRYTKNSPAGRPRAGSGQRGSRPRTESFARPGHRAGQPSALTPAPARPAKSCPARPSTPSQALDASSEVTSTPRPSR